jgi:hypothetical protein
MSSSRERRRGSKLEKARSLGIEVIDEAELLRRNWRELKIEDFRLKI